MGKLDQTRLGLKQAPSWLLSTGRVRCARREQFLVECEEPPTAMGMLKQGAQLSLGGPLLGLAAFGLVWITHSSMVGQAHHTCKSMILVACTFAAFYVRPSRPVPSLPATRAPARPRARRLPARRSGCAAQSPTPHEPQPTGCVPRGPWAMTLCFGVAGRRAPTGRVGRAGGRGAAPSTQRLRRHRVALTRHCAAGGQCDFHIVKLELASRGRVSYYHQTMSCSSPSKNSVHAYSNTKRFRQQLLLAKP